MISKGMLSFVGRRLLRALVSLVLFQILLFAFILALPEQTAAMTEGQMLGQAAAAQAPSESQEEAAPREEDSRLEQAQPRMDPEMIAAAEFYEELGLLDEAAMLMEAAVLENPVMLEEAVAEVDPALLEAGVMLADPALLPGDAVPDDTSAADESSLMEEPVAEAFSYQEGLKTIRPPGEPFLQQFATWMLAFYQGDLGESTGRDSRPVTEILATKIPRTLLLFLPATIIGFLLGIWLGKRIGWRRRGWLDFGASLGGAAFYTSFPPWLAFLVISLFALNLRWFPSEKLVNPFLWFGVDLTLNELLVRVLLTLTAATIAYLALMWLTRGMKYNRTRVRLLGALGILVVASIPWIMSDYAPLALDLFAHLVLPVGTLVLLSFGESMLIMRTTMLEAKEGDHVALARARGLSDSEVRDRHVARIAILPVLTRFVVYLPFVIVGGFVIEHFFFWDGMGQALVQAANDNDLPVLLGVLSLVGIGILLAHLILDLISAGLDPRLRTTKKAEAA